MKRWQKILVSVLFFLAIGACAGKPGIVEQWADPSSQTIEKASYRIVFEPLKTGGKSFRTFSLMLENKAAAEIEIDWNQTRYVHNQNIMGGFVFAGIGPEDAKAGTIPADKVGGGETFQREIAPQRLLAFAAMRDKSVAPGQSGINAGPLPEGRNGIVLLLRMDGKEFREHLAVDIGRGK
jgi:hypothetical protein